MDEPWKCASCGLVFEPGDAETWHNDSGDTIEVPTFSTIYAGAEPPLGDPFWMCESCYEAGRYSELKNLKPAVLQELHLDFVAEYRKAKKYDQAKAAVDRARALGETAMVLFLHSGLLSDLGERDAAHEALRRVERLDPSFWMASWNLTAGLVHEGNAQEGFDRVCKLLSQRSPDSLAYSDLLMLKARAAHQLGRTTEAEEAFHEAVRTADCETCRQQHREEWVEILGG